MGLKEEQYDKLGIFVRKSLDMKKIYEILKPETECVDVKRLIHCTMAMVKVKNGQAWDCVSGCRGYGMSIDFPVPENNKSRIGLHCQFLDNIDGRGYGGKIHLCHE